MLKPIFTLKPPSDTINVLSLLLFTSALITVLPLTFSLIFKSIVSLSVLISVAFSSSFFAASPSLLSSLATVVSLNLILLALPSTNNAPSCILIILLSFSDNLILPDTFFTEPSLLMLILTGLFSVLSARTSECLPNSTTCLKASSLKRPSFLPLVLNIN